MNSRRSLLLFLMLVLMFSCSEKSKQLEKVQLNDLAIQDVVPETNSFAADAIDSNACEFEQVKEIEHHQLEIMSYNVENLFDTLHDEGRNDWTFTPGHPEYKEYECMLSTTNPYYLHECLNTNWDKDHLDFKLGQIERVIREGRTSLPDVLALVEVENGRGEVIKQLAERLGYTDSHIATTDDKRGVATAVLYNRSNPKFDSSFEFKFFEIEHPNPRMNTRRVLEVQFAPITVTNNSLDQNVVSLYINHWPSQGKRTPERLSIATEVMKSVNERMNANPNHHIIVTGDFNTIDEETPHPIRSVLLTGNDVLDGEGKVVGNNDLVDVYSRLTYDQQAMLPLGSYFYYRFGNMQWNQLDNFFVSQNLINMSFKQDITDGLSIYKSSYEIMNPCFMTRDHVYNEEQYPNFGSTILGTPKDYDTTLDVNDPNQGFSDHFPIVLRLKL
jgi:exonuclease III